MRTPFWLDVRPWLQRAPRWAARICFILVGLAAASAQDGEWRMAAKDYANTRYSELDQITVGNVKQLEVAWTFSTGLVRGHEAAPLVVGDTMYVVTPYPNVLYALDLTKNGAVKWTYEPKPSSSAQGVACCDVVNRGAAFWEGKIYYNTLDAHTVAVDAATGREVWKTKVGDINLGESTIPMNFSDLFPIAAAGYSLIYLLFGGGLGGAVLIFIVAKLLGR